MLDLQGYELTILELVFFIIFVVDILDYLIWKVDQIKSNFEKLKHHQKESNEE